jgi:protein-tyrosine phosphatase
MEPDAVDHAGHPFALYGPTLVDLGRKEGVEISVKRFPIRDLDVPSAETMNAILDEIDRCMGQGAAVYIHCWGGRGRTGTVVGCYLVRHGLTGEGALRRIAELRRNQPDGHLPSPEMRDQVKMVKGWGKWDRKRT